MVWYYLWGSTCMALSVLAYWTRVWSRKDLVIVPVYVLLWPLIPAWVLIHSLRRKI